jgi:hypothetical protein
MKQLAMPLRTAYGEVKADGAKHPIDDPDRR